MTITNPVKRVLKRGMQYFAAHFGPHTRNPERPQLLILMYHRILPRHDERACLEEPGMVVTPQTFHDHLEILSDYFEFVSLSDWLNRRQNNQPLPVKACAITFDDGWADNYQFAFPILQRKNIPATIFLVADMIGTQLMFWPERLARLSHAISLQEPSGWADPVIAWLKQAKTDFKFDGAPPTTEQITQLIAHAKMFTDEEIHGRLNKTENELGIRSTAPVPPLLNWEEIKEMTDSGLIEVGSHTCNHIRLNNQTPSDILSKEIIGSKKTIEQYTGKDVNTFCFPNGDYTDTALKLVRETYQGAVTTKNGWNLSQTDSHLLHRIGIHEDIASDRISFLGRISGWL